MDQPVQLRKRIVVGLSVLFTLAGRLMAEDFAVKVNVAEYQFGVGNVPVKVELAPPGTAINGEYEARLAVTDRYTGQEVLAEKKPFTLPLAEANGKLAFDAGLPFGSYHGTLRIISTASQAQVAETKFPIQKMTQGCDHYASEAQREYEVRFGTVGGCMDYTTPADSEKIGRRWFRFEGPNWEHLETSPGVYDFTPLIEAAKQWKAVNVRLQTLQTVYSRPKFYAPSDLPTFSAAYGRYLQAFGKAFDGLVTEHELGNEDNGSTKFLYTEVARQGSAGMRSSQPWSVIGNSGTAHVDYVWLDVQAKRGLFDTIDAVVVHPYTNNSTCSEAVSFERSGSLKYLEQLYQLVFDVGGMKEIWNTEFGWPNGDTAAEQARTKLFTRALLICDAAGMTYNTVYNFDRDYNTSHFPAVVPLHNFVRERMGTRLVGFDHDPANDVYTSVYEGSGRAFAVQWTSRDEAVAVDRSRFDLSGGQAAYTDMFGNTLAERKISQEPTYIHNISPDVVSRLAQNQVAKTAGRFQAFLSRSSSREFKSFAGIKPGDISGLRQALVRWLDGQKTTIPKEEQALFDFALRWYLAGSRYLAAPANDATAYDFAAADKLVRDQVAEGLDVPSVRYLHRLADRIQLESRMAGDDREYQARCSSELALLQRATRVFSEHGQRVQYAVFANLYQMRDGQLGEKLYFVPGRPTTVRCRVSSYRPVPEKVTVRPDLPTGWTGTQTELEVPANGEAWGELTITAPSGASDKDISIRSQIAGKPDRVTRFNNIEYLPAVSVEVGLLRKWPGKLSFTLHNEESRPAGGTMILRPAGEAGAPLAIVPFNVPANGQADASVTLPTAATTRLAAAGYSMDAQFELADQRQFSVRGLGADFVVATRMPAGVGIDANLDDWKTALPLKLDKDAYTWGSYGSNWSPEDCSAVTYLGWDEEKLYFAAEVRDQTFNQQLDGGTVWQQDSIQLLLTARAGETDPAGIHGVWLALTKRGPLAFSARDERALEGAAVAITYAGGNFIYECAIPWSALGNDYRDVCKRGGFGYAIAVNDDDAIVPRRYLERFRGSVVHGRDLKTFASVVLGSAAPPREGPETPPHYVFRDDFAAYEDGSIPLGYSHAHSKSPPDVLLIRAGVGENGGNALRMTSP